jgi:hypothetical protein
MGTGFLVIVLVLLKYNVHPPLSDSLYCTWRLGHICETGTLGRIDTAITMNPK